jgi:hypothetical protein
LFPAAGRKVEAVALEKMPASVRRPHPKKRASGPAAYGQLRRSEGKAGNAAIHLAMKRF